MPWTVLTKVEVQESLYKILLWGGLGALFTFVRILVIREAKSKMEFFSALFVGAVIGSLIGWTLEPMAGTLVGGIAPYVAISAILADKIVLFILECGTEFLRDPRSLVKVVKKVIDKDKK